MAEPISSSGSSPTAAIRSQTWSGSRWRDFAVKRLVLGLVFACPAQDISQPPRLPPIEAFLSPMGHCAEAAVKQLTAEHESLCSHQESQRRQDQATRDSHIATVE